MRNLPDGFYIVTPDGADVEWYAKLPDAERAVERRADGSAIASPLIKVLS